MKCQDEISLSADDANTVIQLCCDCEKDHGGRHWYHATEVNPVTGKQVEYVLGWETK